MTDLPPTDALKGLLARATRGPWTAFDWEPPESDGQQVFGRHIGSMRDTTTVAKVLGTTSGLLDGFAAPIRQADANARLIALAPTLAARVIEQDARIARLTEALRLHQAWSDSEDAGPDYGAQTRDTHPDGERIWRQWWDGNLDLCARAQEATRAALEDGQ